MRLLGQILVPVCFIIVISMYHAGNHGLLHLPDDGHDGLELQGGSVVGGEEQVQINYTKNHVKY